MLVSETNDWFGKYMVRKTFDIFNRKSVYTEKLTEKGLCWQVFGGRQG